MRSMMKRFVVPFASAVLIASPAIAEDMGGSAQDDGQMQGQTQDQAATGFSAQKLQSFAGAVTGIQQVARDYAPRLREAETLEQVSELEKQAQTEMLQTVENEGLTVEEYNQIATAAQGDPRLAAEIQGYMADTEGSAPDGPN